MGCKLLSPFAGVDPSRRRELTRELHTRTVAVVGCDHCRMETLSLLTAPGSDSGRHPTDCDSSMTKTGG